MIRLTLTLTEKNLIRLASIESNENDFWVLFQNHSVWRISVHRNRSKHNKAGAMGEVFQD